MTKTEEPETMVCIPANSPDDKFILIGGNKIMLKDFIRFVAGKYIAMALYERRENIADIIAELHNKNQGYDLPADTMLLMLLHYVYHNEIPSVQNFDSDVLNRFAKNEFLEFNRMQRLLIPQDFARWRLFRLY